MLAHVEFQCTFIRENLEALFAGMSVCWPWRCWEVNQHDVLFQKPRVLELLWANLALMRSFVCEDNVLQGLTTEWNCFGTGDMGGKHGLPEWDFRCRTNIAGFSNSFKHVLQMWLVEVPLDLLLRLFGTFDFSGWTLSSTLGKMMEKLPREGQF